MDVSVVIPLYNGARWIEDTIRSVLAQTHLPREIVVVDDGSEDGSRDIVRSAFPEVRMLQTPNEGGDGAGPARSMGLQHTSAPLVAFLDQDDLWHPDHLRILTRLLTNNRFPAAVAEPDHFRDSSSPSYDLQPDNVHHFSPWERYPLNGIHSPSCAVVRRDALERIGGWPSEFTISDMNAWFKLTTDAPMLRTEKVSVGKRVHSDSYLETLRAEDALSFLKDHIRVCEDAFTFRMRRTSEDEAVYNDRLETLRRIGDVLEGVVSDDVQRIKDAAYFLERESRVGPAMERALWFFGLRLFTMPKSQIPAIDASKQRLVLGKIISGWPNPCRRARSSLAQALTQTMSYKAFLLCVMRTPFPAVTSLLFFECMKLQLKKASEKITEHVHALFNSSWRFFVEWFRFGTATSDQLQPGS